MADSPNPDVPVTEPDVETDEKTEIKSEVQTEVEIEAQPEMRPEVKEEDAGEDKSDNDADAVEHDTGEEPAVSNDQYRAFKNVTEILTNLKVKVKGDEYVRLSDVALSRLTKF